MPDPVKNFALATVSTGYNASATSIVLSSGDGAKFPAPSTDGAFNVVWWNFTDYADPADDPNKEIVRVTARSTDTLTVTRAQEGTSASTKNTSAKVYKLFLGPTKKTIDDLFKENTTYVLDRTLQATNNDYVEIGSFNMSNASHNIGIEIGVCVSGYVQAAVYLIPVNYDITAGVWQEASSIVDSLSSGGRVVVDVKVSANTAYFRIRTKVGLAAPSAAVVRVTNYGHYDDVFTPTSATGTASPVPSVIYDRKVRGDANVTNVDRALPATVNDYINIGTLNRTNGAHTYMVSAVCDGSGISIGKQYIISGQFDGSGTWYEALPIASSGAYSGHDFAIDVQHSSAGHALRLRKTGGASTETVNIRIIDFNVFDTFAASSSTGSASAPTSYEPSSFIENSAGTSTIKGAQVITGDSSISGKQSVKAGSSTGTIAKVGGAIFDHAADAGNTTTSETDLYTDTLPASILSTNNDKVTATYGGIIVGSTSSKRIRAYFAGTLIFDSTAVAVAANTDWSLSITGIRVSSSVVRFVTRLVTSGVIAFVDAQYVEVTGLTLTNTAILKITGTASSTGAATNDIVAKLGTLSWYPAA